MKTIKSPPSEPKPSQPFEKFERLARVLIAVPKKELAKEFAKHERKKTTKKRQRS